MSALTNYATYIAAVLMAAYLVIMLYLAKQLEQRHPAAWISIGRFSFSTWSIVNSILFFTYVFFRGAHKQLNDRKVSHLVYLARTMFALAMASLILSPARQG